MTQRWLRMVSLFAMCGACNTRSTDREVPPTPVAASAEDAAAQTVSAFAPSDDAGCRRGYAIRQEICVHEAFDEHDAAALDDMISSYKRGARAPLLHIGPADAGLRDVRKRVAALAPDALSSGAMRDAEAAKQKRLLALDAMLTRLRAKSGEGARAKGGSEAAGPADDGDHTATAVAGGTGTSNTSGGVVGLPGAAGGDLAQKLEELKALVQRLPESDSAKLRTQLARDGFTEDEMRGLLPEVR